MTLLDNANLSFCQNILTKIVDREINAQPDKSLIFDQTLCNGDERTFIFVFSCRNPRAIDILIDPLLGSNVLGEIMASL